MWLQRRNEETKKLKQTLWTGSYTFPFQNSWHDESRNEFNEMFHNSISQQERDIGVEADTVNENVSLNQPVKKANSKMGVR